MTASRTTFENTPITKFFGFEMGALSDGVSEVLLSLRPEFTQEEGVVHGGVLTALADTAAVYAISPRGPESRPMTGLEFKLSFLRAARPEGPALVARGKAVHRGRTTGLAEVELFQGEQKIGIGLFTFLFLDQKA